MGQNNIIQVNDTDRDKKTLEFIKQAQGLLSIGGSIPISLPDLIIHLNLVMAELSIKALCIHHLGKYEKTHFLKNTQLLDELLSHITPNEEIKENIESYKEFADKYYSESRYSETGLTLFSEEQEKIDKVSRDIINFMWGNLNDLIKKDRDKQLEPFYNEFPPKLL